MSNLHILTAKYENGEWFIYHNNNPIPIRFTIELRLVIEKFENKEKRVIKQLPRKSNKKMVLIVSKTYTVPDTIMETINSQLNTTYQTNAITIQKWFRGCILRLKRLPLIMYQIQNYLQKTDFEFSTNNEDGRINSCTDEDQVTKLLTNRFNNKIKKPEKRHWYDILAYDNMYGWIPINIKTTTTTTCDNTGNLAMCVYAYTDEVLDIHNSSYQNGNMSVILFDKLKNKKYNKNNKKDYYFIVLNKQNPRDVIVNSVKGLTTLTGNINNLPFQVRWDKNRTFTYENIDKKVKQFIDCLQKPNPSWQEKFMSNIRTLKL